MPSWFIDTFPPLAQVLTSGFSPLPLLLASAFWRGFTLVDGFSSGLFCMFLFWLFYAITNCWPLCPSSKCLADWRAIRPGHTQAAPSKKKISTSRCWVEKTLSKADSRFYLPFPQVFEVSLFVCSQWCNSRCGRVFGFCCFVFNVFVFFLSSQLQILQNAKNRFSLLFIRAFWSSCSSHFINSFFWNGRPAESFAQLTENCCHSKVIIRFQLCITTKTTLAMFLSWISQFENMSFDRKYGAPARNHPQFDLAAVNIRSIFQFWAEVCCFAGREPSWVKAHKTEKTTDKKQLKI